jgi:hypothetical protein
VPVITRPGGGVGVSGGGGERRTPNEPGGETERSGGFALGVGVKLRPGGGVRLRVAACGCGVSGRIGWLAALGGVIERPAVGCD